MTDSPFAPADDGDDYYRGMKQRGMIAAEKPWLVSRARREAQWPASQQVGTLTNFVPPPGLLLKATGEDMWGANPWAGDKPPSFLQDLLRRLGIDHGR